MASIDDIEYVKQIFDKTIQKPRELHEKDLTFKGDSFSYQQLSSMLKAMLNINVDEFGKRRTLEKSKLIKIKYSKLAVRTVLKEVLAFYKNVDRESYLDLIDYFISLKGHKSNTSDDLFEHESSERTNKSQLDVQIDGVSSEMTKQIILFLKRDHCSPSEAIIFIDNVTKLINEKYDEQRDNNLTDFYLNEAKTLLSEIYISQRLSKSNPDSEFEIIDAMNDKINLYYRSIVLASQLISFGVENNLESLNQINLDNLKKSLAAGFDFKDIIPQVLSITIVPYMVQKSNQNPDKSLDMIRSFGESIRKHDLDSALSIFDIDFQDEKCNNLLVEAYRDFIIKYRYNGIFEKKKLPRNDSKYLGQLINANNNEEIKFFDDLAKKSKEDMDKILSWDTTYKGIKIPIKILSGWMDSIKLFYIRTRKERKKYQKINPYVFIDTEKIVPMALQFYKDLDKSFYDKVIQLIKKGNISIYNPYLEENKEMIQKGELSKVSKKSGTGESLKTYTVVLGDMKENEYEEYSDIIGKHMALIDALFSFVHEEGHTLDDGYVPQLFKLNYSGKIEEPKKGDGVARLYLAEATAILFENILGDYLIQKDKANIPIVKRRNRYRIDETEVNVNQVGIISGIVEVFENKKDGKTLTDYKRVIANYECGYEQTKKTLPNNFSVFPAVMYVLGLLLVPTFIKRYKEDRASGRLRVINYVNCIKQNDFKGALASFDVDLTSQKSVDELFDNLMQYMKEQYEGSKDIHELEI